MPLVVHGVGPSIPIEGFVQVVLLEEGQHLKENSTGLTLHG